MRTEVRKYREMNALDIRRLLPVRPRKSHKGNYGKILMLCGSTGFTGAARMAAKAAMRTGSGLVYLGVPDAVYPIVAAGLEEPVVFPLPCDENGRFSAKAISLIREKMAGMDAILIGPGVGKSDAVCEIVVTVLAESRVPVLLDADGINVLQGHKHLLRKKNCSVILTPHDGEFARLYEGAPLGRYRETLALARETGCIVLRKGYRTLISDGEITYRNQTGNPGMAKGGSGDVLSGILVSLLGQKIPPLEAAALAAWIHGAAGDFCAKEMGEYGMLPSDMIEAIPKIIK